MSTGIATFQKHKKKSTSSGIEPKSLLTIEECRSRCGINVIQCATITPRGLVCRFVELIFGDVVYDSSPGNAEELSMSKFWYSRGLWRSREPDRGMVRMPQHSGDLLRAS